MTPKSLANKIKKLSDNSKKTNELNKKLGILSPSPKAWYKNQKEHWIGWLQDYPTGGAYGRKNSKRDAEYIYNHIQNISMLFWLCEAAGVSNSVLNKAIKNIVSTSERKQCGALREVIPWPILEKSLSK